jgi:hypothetical protein
MDGLPRPIEDDLYEIANLFPRTTELPMTVWVSPRGGARHDARVKVSTRPGDRITLDELAVVGVRPVPSLIEGTLAAPDLEVVSRWIELNREAIIGYWDGALDTLELAQALRRV